MTKFDKPKAVKFKKYKGVDIIKTKATYKPAQPRETDTISKLFYCKNKSVLTGYNSTLA